MSFFSRSSLGVDVKRTEEYLGRVEGLLGYKVQGRIQYFRYERPEDIAAATGRWAAGITYPRWRQIHSTRSFHPHEIVHVVAGRLGTPGTFFQEGLAVAVGDRGKWRGASVDRLSTRLVKRVPLARVMASFDRFESDVAYPVAGSFVAHLIRRHGIKKVALFFEASRRTTLDAAFVAAFHTSFAAARREWADEL